MKLMDNVKENNKILAEFMGLNSKESWTTLWMPSGEPNDLNNLIHAQMQDETWYVTSLRFDESWDWLIPVLKKIEPLNIQPEELYQDKFEQKNSDIWYALVDLDIEGCFNACVEFIKEYNKIKK